MPFATKKQQMASARRQPKVNPAESPIAWLRRRKDRHGEPMISQSQFDAGERLRADFWFAQMTPRVTANWSTLAPINRRRRSGAGSSGDVLDNVAAARERRQPGLGRSWPRACRSLDRCVLPSKGTGGSGASGWLATSSGQGCAAIGPHKTRAALWVEPRHKSGTGTCSANSPLGQR